MENIEPLDKNTSCYRLEMLKQATANGDSQAIIKLLRYEAYVECAVKGVSEIIEGIADAIGDNAPILYEASMVLKEFNSAFQSIHRIKEKIDSAEYFLLKKEIKERLNEIGGLCTDICNIEVKIEGWGDLTF